MMKKQPEEKMIGDMLCYSREKAADYIGMGISTLDRITKLSRKGRATVKIKFIQIVNGAPIWYPKEWLDSFVLSVMEKGYAIKNNKRNQNGTTEPD